MQEIIEKIKERLMEKVVNITFPLYPDEESEFVPLETAIEIVNQVAEEYKQDLDKVKQESKQGWIPVSERLPEEKGIDKPYLCSFEWGEIMVCRWQKWADNIYRWVRVDDSYYEAKPIAWMPLPEPYRTEGE